MSTLVTILLAIVMEVISPKATSSFEVKDGINHIEVQETLFFTNELSTFIPTKTC